jgi:large subunit ribosomal protein L12
MKYVYAALLLHSSGQKIDEETIKKVVSATGGEVDEARVKALVASLADVNIEAALKAGPALAAASPAPIKEAAQAPEAKKEEKKEGEEKKKEEEAVAGLGALFG